jgi:Na+/proline symporter
MIHFFYQGGMKAVIWTDVLQAVVIFIGLLAAMIQGYKTTSQKNKSKLLVSF